MVSTAICVTTCPAWPDAVLGEQVRLVVEVSWPTRPEVGDRQRIVEQTAGLGDRHAGAARAPTTRADCSGATPQTPHGLRRRSGTNGPSNVQCSTPPSPRDRVPSKPSETSSLSAAHIGSSPVRGAPVATSSSWRSRRRAVTTTVSSIAIDPAIAMITSGSSPDPSTARQAPVCCSCPTLERRSRVAPTRDTNPIDPCDLN